MSKRNMDAKNRWRNKIVAFRVSDEEAAELDDRVKLCGARTKADYIIESVLHQEIVAKGNPMMLVQFRRDLQNIEKELKRLNDLSEINEELMTPIRTMLEIMEAFQKKDQENG